MAKVVDSVYAPFARANTLPSARLASHPTENQIVTEAVAEQLPRLRHEITTARPEVIVTLGNAALRVLASLAAEQPTISNLSPTSYGTALTVTVGEAIAQWYPLAHPAAPTPYQEAHRNWDAR